MADFLDNATPARYLARPSEDGDGVRLEWSGARAGLWGIAVRDFPGQAAAMDRLLGDVAAQSFVDDLRQIMRRGAPVATDYRCPAAGGGVRWVRHTAVPLDGGLAAGALEDASGMRSVPPSASHREELLDNLPLKILRMTPDMSVTWANQNARDSFIDWEQHYGEKCHAAAFGLAEPCPGCPVIRARETGEAQTAEFTLPDGQTFLIIGIPRHGPDGRLEALVEVAQDISHIARERAAKERHFRDLSDIIGTIQDGICVLDADRRILLANDTMRERFKHRDNGKVCYQEVENREVHCRNCPMDRTLATGQPSRDEIQVPDPDGKMAWFERRAYPFHGMDGQARVILQVRDITESVLRHQEDEHRNALLEGILQASENAIAAFDGDTRRLLQTNTPMVRLLGLDGREDMEGWDEDRLLERLAEIASDPEPLRRLRGQAAQGGTGLLGRGELADGRTVSISLARLPATAGHSPIPIWYFRDETAEIRLAVAAESDRTKNWFLTAMSHELRTPLGGIFGMAEALRETELDAIQHECVAAIARCGRDLLAVIDNVLLFTALESGAMRPRPRPFDPRALLQDLRQEFLPLAAERSLALAVDCDAGLPERFVGDSEALRRMLANLLANGIKFTPAGRVRLAAERGEDGALRLQVSDTGVGIRPEAMSKLFDHFSQADEGNARPYGGIGLGLAICRRLVALMGGEISMDSHPGQGTTVTVVLKQLATNNEQ